jgi:hypothetical protein
MLGIVVDEIIGGGLNQTETAAARSRFVATRNLPVGTQPLFFEYRFV